MKKLLIVLLVLVGAVVAAGHVMSPDMNLSRTVVIKAPVAKVHEYIGDLKNWPAWEPWTDPEAGGDPTIKVTYGPATSGVGAHQSWTGKDGEGELTFTKSDSNEGITYDMAFIQGESKLPSQGKLTYKPVDGGVEVTWSMDAKMDMACCGGAIKYGPIMAALMKGSIGDMFQFGLDKLKKKAEGGA